MDTTTAPTLKDILHKKIDEMDDYQLRLVDSFLTELFDLDD